MSVAIEAPIISQTQHSPPAVPEEINDNIIQKRIDDLIPPPAAEYLADGIIIYKPTTDPVPVHGTIVPVISTTDIKSLVKAPENVEIGYQKIETPLLEAEAPQQAAYVTQS